MNFLIGGFLILGAFAITILYSALVVASEADDMEEEYWQERKQIK